ncbi:methyl-accepting chemotaxis protein [Clostridium folliculivorans]|uniref:Methyl-accepting chemotaxis protein n=1 Tax=Clostridium folliculivorans TaxID=2886038 RepID=A0A9W6DCH0_9CLOT|nr:methyl-accepting chemotaxis protein [Clostridium folliculivorans]GKU26987.1 methyl-accepting chemotaxis protein [Clostridium folliculivorans]GKU29171.1 methyl-accepting chemotaxis protein [Clostridium folliculivorans]
MKFKTIKKKLILTFILIILVPMCTTGIISNVILYNNLKSSYVSSIEKSVTGVNNVIDESYNGYEAALSQITEDSVVKAALSNPGGTLVKKELTGIINSNPKILNAYVATEDKGMYIFPETKLPEGYNPTEKSWYKDTMSNDMILWQDAYKDVATGKIVVTATKKVLDDSGKAVGVAGIDIDITNIAVLFKSTKIEKTGEILLLDRTGIVLATKNNDLLGKNLNPDRVNTNADTKDQKVEDAFSDKTEMSWMKPLLEGKSNFVQVKFNGTSKFIYYISNEKSGWKLMGMMDTSEVYSKILSNVLILAGFFVLFIVGALMVGLWISRSLTKPINHLKEAMKKGEAGDLTVVTNINSSDELGELGSRFSNMISSVKNLVTSVKSSADNVLSFSEDLTKRAEEVTSSSEEIARVIDEISKGVQEQAYEVDKASEIATEFNNNLSKIKDYNNKINTESKEMEASSEKTMVAFKELKTKNESTINGVSEISESIGVLVKETEDIGQILSTILNISSQTNLLALNAAIEAARAGESGRGFAVVAEEVRMLAEQSGESAVNIRNIITRVIETTKTAAVSMDNIKADVENQNSAMSTTEQSFVSLSESIESIIGKIISMNESIELMLTNSGILTSNIHNISFVSEQSAAAAEEVNASVSNQLNDMQNVKAQADELYNLAQALETLIEKFQV